VSGNGRGDDSHVFQWHLELVPLPPDKQTVGCHWVYTVKIGSDGHIDRLKARLVAKGCTQIFGRDYGDTFYPVAKIIFVRLFLAMAAIHHWSLHPLDIKNAFLHGELQEEVYMDQLPSFLSPDDSRLVCKLQRSLWFETIFSGLVWSFQFCLSSVWHDQV